MSGFRFRTDRNEYYLNSESQELWIVDKLGMRERVNLSPTPLKVLHSLLKHAPLTVSPRELSKDAVGGLASTTDVQKAISTLRKGLGDRHAIVTDRDMGYRFNLAFSIGDDKWQRSAARTKVATGASAAVEGHLGGEADFEIHFDPDFAPQEVKEILTALADYYRACGGAGLALDLEAQEATVTEPVHV
jgi:DNA-binding winged helix-turn-helix (wHTH) protein